MLGLVTLYRPDVNLAVDNIRRYLPHLDALVIWDNSPLDMNIKEQVVSVLDDFLFKIVWQGTGENKCIAPAINYAWRYAQAQEYDFLLIMDQDSWWDDFSAYRKQIEHYWLSGSRWVFTPFFENSRVETDKPVQFLRLFINSGTVIPTEILTAIGGADERMPLDAVDHDLAVRIQKKGFQIACITSCTLRHNMGTPTYSAILHLKTSNYNSWRTYSIARSHAINLRKHADWFSLSEKKRIIKEYYLRRLVLIILSEDDKWNRIMMLIKGTIDGIRFPLK